MTDETAEKAPENLEFLLKSAIEVRECLSRAAGVADTVAREQRGFGAWSHLSLKIDDALGDCRLILGAILVRELEERGRKRA